MNKRGLCVERELVNMLWNADCAAMRAPASGGATKRPLPDIIAGNGKVYLAIEVKTTSTDHVYINSRKIVGLMEFSEIFGAEPYLGVKFKNKKWRFVVAHDLIKTRGGNYKVDMDLAYNAGLEFDELIKKDKQV
ncbi:MAG: Holliday junction resolvase Hjc [Methanobacteriaceae archaeon]|jgi:Holliday junction resolvase